VYTLYIIIIYYTHTAQSHVGRTNIPRNTRGQKIVHDIVIVHRDLSYICILYISYSGRYLRGCMFWAKRHIIINERDNSFEVYKTIIICYTIINC